MTSSSPQSVAVRTRVTTDSFQFHRMNGDMSSSVRREFTISRRSSFADPSTWLCPNQDVGTKQPSFKACPGIGSFVDSQIHFFVRKSLTLSARHPGSPQLASHCPPIGQRQPFWGDSADTDLSSAAMALLRSCSPRLLRLRANHRSLIETHSKSPPGFDNTFP